MSKVRLKVPLCSLLHYVLNCKHLQSNQNEILNNFSMTHALGKRVMKEIVKNDNELSASSDVSVSIYVFLYAERTYTLHDFPLSHIQFE